MNMKCDRCNHAWQFRPFTQFPNGKTTLAICKTIFGTDTFTHYFCNECYEHYKYAVVKVLGYTEDEEEDDEEYSTEEEEDD